MGRISPVRFVAIVGGLRALGVVLPVPNVPDAVNEFAEFRQAMSTPQ